MEYYNKDEEKRSKQKNLKNTYDASNEILFTYFWIEIISSLENIYYINIRNYIIYNVRNVFKTKTRWVIAF